MSDQRKQEVQELLQAIIDQLEDARTRWGLVGMKVSLVLHETKNPEATLDAQTSESVDFKPTLVTKDTRVESLT